MEKIRKGNDITVLWEIYAVSGGTERPYDLSGRNLTLYLRSPFGKEKVQSYSIEANTIRFTFYGKDQSHIGKYSLTLVENEGVKGMHTLDECDAFELVSCSCKACGEPESKVEMIILGLKGTMTMAAGMFEIDDYLSTTSKNAVQNKVITAALEKKAEQSAVPTKTSQLKNDSSFITKNEVPDPDWNASTYKEGHIKNRTHHMQDHMCHYFKGSPIKVSKPSGVGYVLLAYDTDLADKFIRIDIKADESKTHEFLDAMGMPLIFRWDAGNSTINVESFAGAVEAYGMRAYYSSSAKSFDEYFVTLDDGFIPESVARKSEIAELDGELTKKAEVHIIMNIDGFEDIIFEGNDDIHMRDADVDAILSGKLIAADSPMNGYILADEVYYDAPHSYPRMGFIVFHYDEKEVKVVFDLTNKVYLGSQSYIKAIAQKDYVDGKLAELSEKVNELDKGEAYIMGDTLTFRNYANASIEGETLKL